MTRKIIVFSLLATVLLGVGGMLLVGGHSAPAATTTAAERLPARSATSPAVLELFTSQGCSSCPPADELAAMLAVRRDVIVISRPVTYWDRLGWRDTLAMPANTALQRAYAGRGLGGYNGVYTPQAVVDGRSGEVGSDRTEIEAMLRVAARRTRPRLVLDRAGGTVTVEGAQNARAQLLLIGMRAHESVVIARGENGNRTLSYTNVYRGTRDLGAWRGGEQVFALGRSPLIPGADTHALILREGESGPILAAARL